MIRSTGVPFAIAWPCARWVDAMTSSRVERRADAGRGCLLPDRDVQEPGQLACPEAILDLLLEPADEEHLAEEAAQHFFGDASPSGPGSLFDGRHRAAIMLIRRCEPPISGHRSRRASRPTGPRHGSRSRPKGRSRTLRRSSGRSSRAVSARSFDSTSRGRTEARSARATSSGGSTGRRIWGTLALLGVVGRRAADSRRTAAAPRATSLVESLGRGSLRAPARLERSSVRARARLERPPPARRAPRCAPEPDARGRVRTRSASAVPESRATASSPGWRAAASSAWTQRGSRGASRSCRFSRTPRTPRRRARSGGSPAAPSEPRPLADDLIA